MKRENSLILSSSIQISAFFSYYLFSSVTLLYNTFKHIANWTLIFTLVQYCTKVVLKDVVLDIVAGVYESSMQVRLQTVPRNGCAYCLATLGPFAVTLSNEMHSLFRFCLTHYDEFCTAFVVFILWAEKFVIWVAFSVLPPLNNQLKINLCRSYIYCCKKN